MLGAFIFGSLNGVGFQDPSERRRIYSFASFSWPGDPTTHQLIIHRAMMAVFGYSFQMYAFGTLPANISIPLTMLLPFFVAGAAWLTFPEERVGP